jgi:hypothetical protein
MKTSRKSLLTLGTAILACTGLLRAQSLPSAAPAPPPRGPDMFMEGGRPGPMFDEIGFLGFERGISGKTVQGAPFTATISTQTTQVLADGNQIQRNANGNIARDSSGRTRREMSLPAVGPWAASGKPAPQAIFINDPVAGVHYVLHPDTKVANKLTPGAHGWGHKSDPDVKEWKGNRQKNVVTAPLGVQMINGVSAEGTRYTRTIPAGAIGNEKPIEIVTERWYSSDLQTVVMLKRTDPLRGNMVYQLTNIQRSEPAPALFQVPSDLSIQEGGSGRLGLRHERIVPPAE